MIRRPKNFTRPAGPVSDMARNDASFKVRNEADGVVMALYGEIGHWGIEAATVRRALNEHRNHAVRLDINSPGGDPFDGTAIYNDILEHGNVTTRVVGLAASAASIVAVAGRTVEIGDNAMLMIHNAWTLAIGNAAEMKDVARALEKIDGAIAAGYVAQTGADMAEIRAMMDAETWMDAGDAVEKGFADRIFSEPTDSPQARFRMSHYRNTPEQFRVADREHKPEKPPEDYSGILADLAATMKRMKG